MRKQFLWFHVLEVSPCDSSVFCTVPLSPCALFPLSYSCSKTPNFKMMNFFRHHFFCLPWTLSTTNAVDVGLDLLFQLPQCQLFLSSWGPILHSRQLFLLSISDRLSQKAGHSSPVGHKSCSIWKSRAFPNLYSSISDNVGSFNLCVCMYIYIYIYI